MVIYEWDIETIDPETGDVLEHDHRGDDVPTWPLQPNEHLVLVRDVHNDDDGVINRQWAYVENGKLPEMFDGGARVPTRFHKQINAKV